MNGRCEHCMHWFRREDAEAGVGLGVCRLISETARVGAKNRREPYEFASKMAMVAVDGKRYINSELLTAADFGCVQFEANS